MLRETKNEQEVIDFGQSFSKQLEPGDVVVLNGELGAGKTTFVKGIALGLGIEEPITSPTYTISKLYDNKLCHVDSYRISDEDIGLEDLRDQGFIICVEWSENIKDYLPEIKYIINIEYILEGRKIEIITNK